MTERGRRGVGTPTVVAALLAVAAATCFITLFSQGSFGTPGDDAAVRLDSAFADVAAIQSRMNAVRTRQASLNVTAVVRSAAPVPPPRKIGRLDTLISRLGPFAARPTKVATTSARERIASLDGGVWQSRQLNHIVPYDEPLKQARTQLVPFATAPFPSEGSGRPYKDNRVLMHVPKGFNPNRPAVMIVFFHGHRATLERDVWKRQQVPAQISASGINAVLVAPQFAVDAADSNPGKFANPGGFGRFLDEAAKHFADLTDDPASARMFANMPIIIVAYSGGYVPAAWSIYRGGLGKNRIRGVVLLDALYGELDKFVPWITKSRPGFFVSAFTSSTRRQNNALEQILAEKNVPYSTGTVLDARKWRDGVTFLETGPSVVHRDYVTRSWTENPIKDVLARLNEYRR